ncbi:hypothetical protein [Acinetobacter soli]|uniref:hypothetical protein n=1 Tax=Acinetobacter soli TaxID=487316 RepID=UPI0012305A69|nr:hypothetical protein [Acinetobacter soli]
MDKCREAFERKGNIKIFVKLCMFDDSINEYSSDKLHDYTLGFINGAWWAFQEQQKRVDAANAVIHEYYTGSYQESPDLVVDLEQALKGGEA